MLFKYLDPKMAKEEKEILYFPSLSKLNNFAIILGEIVETVLQSDVVSTWQLSG